jgi:hypothetical protein
MARRGVGLRVRRDEAVHRDPDSHRAWMWALGSEDEEGEDAAADNQLTLARAGPIPVSERRNYVPRE